MVEHQPSKLRVASSNLVARSKFVPDKLTLVVIEILNERTGKLRSLPYIAPA